MTYIRPSWSKAELLKGEKGKYRQLDAEPYAGANGVVYKAELVSSVAASSTPVAVKIFSPRDPLSPEEQKKLARNFRNEVRKTRAVRHWGVVDVLDIGLLPDGSPFTVLSWGSRSLRNALDGENPVGLLCALLGGAQISETIDYLNRNGLIHRDIKPENILLPEEHRPLVADLGIAQILPGFEARQLSAAGIYSETLDAKHPRHYFSPEQLELATQEGTRQRRGGAGNRPLIDLGCSDRYQVGTVCHELIFGNHPDGLPRPLDPSVPAIVRRTIMLTREKAPLKRPPLAVLTGTLYAAFHQYHDLLLRHIEKLGTDTAEIAQLVAANDSGSIERLTYYARISSTRKWLFNAAAQSSLGGRHWQLSPMGVDLRHALVGTPEYDALLTHAERLGRRLTENLTSDQIPRWRHAELLRAPSVTPSVVVQSAKARGTVSNDRALRDLARFIPKVGRAVGRSFVVHSPMHLDATWWVEAFKVGDDAGTHSYISFSGPDVIASGASPAAALASVKRKLDLASGQEQLLSTLILQDRKQLDLDRGLMSSARYMDQLALRGNRFRLRIRFDSKGERLSVLRDPPIADDTSTATVRFSRAWNLLAGISHSGEPHGRRRRKSVNVEAELAAACAAPMTYRWVVRVGELSAFLSMCITLSVGSQIDLVGVDGAWIAKFVNESDLSP